MRLEPFVINGSSGCLRAFALPGLRASAAHQFLPWMSEATILFVEFYQVLPLESMIFSILFNLMDATSIKVVYSCLSALQVLLNLLF
ncbi:hypothetical protein KFK09_016406 [Dendrobium nobile]|uniref:Uncharacterized protein n=1 Tax=Dendrobium nobile TaxID=94219 RepID=A0A8T3AZE7_DENNO|nr:hypothetical protein KFK09_016406 [Dendrobium nobile]